MLYDADKMPTCGPGVMTIRCDDQNCPQFEERVHDDIGKISKELATSLFETFVNMDCSSCGTVLLTAAEFRYAKICIDKFGTLEELESLVQEGIDSMEAGDVVSMKEATKRLADLLDVNIPTATNYEKCTVREQGDDDGIME